MVPLLRIERFGRSGGLVVVTADLKHVAVDLHVAETYGAMALDTHDRRVVGAVGEGIDKDTALKRHLLEGRKLGRFEELGHLVLVAAADVDRLAEYGGLQHDEKGPGRFQHGKTAVFDPLDAHGHAVGRTLLKVVERRDGELDLRRTAVTGRNHHLFTAQAVTFGRRHDVILPVFGVILLQQVGAQRNLDFGILIHGHRRGDRNLRSGRGRIDGDRLGNRLLRIGHVGHRMDFRRLLTAAKSSRSKDEGGD